MTATKADADVIIGLVNDNLVGAKIVRAEFSPDMDPNNYDGAWYRIILELDGEEFYLEPSIDPEGNAPGFLFMEV